MSAPEELPEFLKHATLEELEGVVEDVVKACPNLIIVARALRTVLEEWERAEVATLLIEEY